jgi:hypothetical protein
MLCALLCYAPAPCRFKDDDEAVMLANDTEYGLAAYFYTRDLRRAWHIAEQLEYGMVSVRRSSGSGTLHNGVAAVHTTAHVLCLSTATHNVSLHLAAEGVGGGTTSTQEPACPSPHLVLEWAIRLTKAAAAAAAMI